MTEAVRLLDVNVLVALTVDAHVHHGAAHRALDRMPGAWATCPLTESALVRLLMNPATTGRRVAAVDAVAVLSAIRTQPGWTFIADATSLAEATIDHSVMMGTDQVTDFHLVNLAAAHHALLATFDSRLPGALVESDRRHVEVIAAS